MNLHPVSCLCCSGLLLRGEFSRRRFLAAGGATVATFALQPRSVAAETVPLIPYDSVPTPLHLPDNLYFGEVSGVALNSKGHYINSRVAKVDKNGNWLKSWGERGKGPGQLNTPHSIAADAKDNIYVADRANPRIQA